MICSLHSLAFLSHLSWSLLVPSKKYAFDLNTFSAIFFFIRLIQFSTSCFARAHSFVWDVSFLEVSFEPSAKERRKIRIIESFYCIHIYLGPRNARQRRILLRRKWLSWIAHRIFSSIGSENFCPCNSFVVRADNEINHRSLQYRRYVRANNVICFAIGAKSSMHGSVSRGAWANTKMQTKANIEIFGMNVNWWSRSDWAENDLVAGEVCQYNRNWYNTMCAKENPFSFKTNTAFVIIFVRQLSTGTHIQKLLWQNAKVLQLRFLTNAARISVDSVIWCKHKFGSKEYFNALHFSVQQTYGCAKQE